MNYKPVKVKSIDKQRQIIDPDTQVVKGEMEKGIDNYDKTLDACGLCCPGPLIQVKASIDQLNDGQILKVSASDPGFYEDIKAWCSKTNNELVDIRRNKGTIIAFIKKGNKFKVLNNSCPSDMMLKDNKTMVVFSGDLDKALAAFIIANGAVAMGKKLPYFLPFGDLIF